MELYDVIVIGGGPAGYTAALYTARAGLKTLVLEKLWAGGQLTEASVIDNYPGFPDGVDGVTLGVNMQKSAHRFGVRTVYGEAVAADLTSDPKVISTNTERFAGKSVIIATGAAHRKLGLPKEEALTGKGVGYCAACDGRFYQGKTVAVVGGGNSAVSEALHLSRIAEQVFLIHRRDTLRAEGITQQALADAGNITFLPCHAVTALLGDDRLSGIRAKNNITGEEQELPVEGLFISIGRQPETEIFRGLLPLDEGGYILAGENTETGIPGVYAAGDVRTKTARQIVTATADGATAAFKAQEYLTGQ